MKKRRRVLDAKRCTIAGTLVVSIALAIACGLNPVATDDAREPPAADPPAVPPRFSANHPCGVYALDSRTGRYREANIRSYPFVSGYVLRPSWPELEPAKDRYDFTMVDQVVQRLQAIGKKLSLEVIRPPEPSYIVETPGVATWFDTWKEIDTRRPVPWDPYTLARFEAFVRALAEHRIPDATKGGALTRLREHAVLANVNFGIPGAHAAIRDPVEFRIMDMPGYTREKFKDAVLRYLRAITDNFPEQAPYVGFWTVQDRAQPALWEEIRTAILSEFDGVRRPRMGFFQENLAASRDPATGAVFGTPQTSFAATLYQSRNQTPILFQALQGWNTPFMTEAKTANATPSDGIQFAYETYYARYVELYVSDLDDPRYWPSFEQWHARLCRTAE